MVPIGVRITKNTYIEYMNPMARKLLGCSEKKEAEEIMADNDELKNAIVLTDSCLNDSEMVSTEDRISYKDPMGTTHPLGVTTILLKTQNKSLKLSMLLDQSLDVALEKEKVAKEIGRAHV